MTDVSIIYFDSYIAAFTNIKYIYSRRGRPEIVLNNYLYRKNREKYWRCLRFSQHKCRASLIIDANQVRVFRDHNHEDESKTLKEYVKMGQSLHSLQKMFMWKYNEKFENKK